MLKGKWDVCPFVALDYTQVLWYTYDMNVAHLPSSRHPKVHPVSVPLGLPPQPEVQLHFDGSCAPNPGPMKIGYHLNSSVAGNLCAVGAPIGPGTNNEAEYQALLAGMRHALKLGFWNLNVTSDSMLIVNQLQGKWEARNKRLAKLMREARSLALLFNKFVIQHVRRDFNAHADWLAQQLVFSEPALPPTEGSKGNPRLLHRWQAAAIRYWWHRFNPGPYTLHRIFGIPISSIEQIGYSQSYKDANFEEYEAHVVGLLAHPAKVAVESTTDVSNDNLPSIVTFNGIPIKYADITS